MEKTNTVPKLVEGFLRRRKFPKKGLDVLY